MKKIPFLKPAFPDISLVEKDLEAIYKSGIYSNGGQFYEKFRELTEAYLGGDVTVSLVGNATLGLMMAIRRLFLEDRNRVLIQSFTFSAGAQAIIWSGFEPVFLDVSLRDWQADIDQARAYLAGNAGAVAGVVVCNTFGVPNAGIGDWEDLASEYSLPLIIDSAAGFGSNYPDGAKVGTRGDCEIFSFHATKPFAIGEGGAIASSDEEFIADMDRMKNFSFNENRESDFIGLNAKLPEISCAIGTRIFDDFDERLKTRRAILAKYKSRLGSEGGAFQPEDHLSTVPFLSVLFDSGQMMITRDLLEKGIEARNYYNPPLHRHRLFRKFESVSDMAGTERICNSIVSLPMFEALRDSDLDIICDSIKESLKASASAGAL